MSTAESIIHESRGIFERGLKYITITVFGTLGMFFGVIVFGLPALILTDIMFSSAIYVDYFIFLTVFGVSLYASQLMSHGNWTTDDDDEDSNFSKSDQVLAAFSYYNLLIVTGFALANIALSLGNPIVATGFALLAGPVDNELARRFNASPLTIVVALILLASYLINWLTRPSTGTPEPRDIAGITTLERTIRRQRRRRRFFG